MSQGSRALHSIALMLALTVLVACGDAAGPGGSGGPVFGGIGGLKGGYSGTGFSSFGQKLDPQFRYLFFNDAVPEGEWDCDNDGFCGLGGLRNTFGVITEPDSFMFVSTANLTHNGLNVVVRAGGVETIPLTIANAATFSEARVSFEFVYATARINTTHNDSAIVRVKSGTDSATIFKITTGDLQSGKFAMRTGGCGSASIITGRAITYANCTPWTVGTGSLTAFKGKTFVLQFIVSEGAQSVVDAVDQPATFLFRKVQLEAAP